MRRPPHSAAGVHPPGHSGAITESGEAPSLRQIAERVGLTSTSSVHYQLGQLEERGLVRRAARRWRSCQLGS
ncbi:helix-turn-helix domain-containing protein [Streptomyces sp. BE133]|uniref:LexA family protein n=1 Tax=Streptomyces sp. BE133 TaxID=3002523 RepID=UPI002E793882|nr:MarR family transcriptional regulator [Streptomyces sp. BE133]